MSRRLTLLGAMLLAIMIPAAARTPMGAVAEAQQGPDMFGQRRPAPPPSQPPAPQQAPPGAGHPPTAPASESSQLTLLDNERLMIIEFVFPAGFKGEEHAAVADEFAYVLDGEFAVVTKGKGKRTLRPGEVEYATKGTMHYSLNETGKPSRVLVVLLKGS